MRQINKILFLFISILMFSTCIEPFNINIDDQNAAKYVVYGQLNDQEGYQTVTISMSSSLEKPKYTPVTKCKVKIIDNLGNVFNLTDFENGNYQVWMGKEYLKPGISYQINILTSSGIEIVSEFEKMPECPEVDSIYYTRKDIQTTNPDKPLKGVQFYVDIDRQNTSSKYFRWDIIETWEHHAVYPKGWFWNMSSIVKADPLDYSRFYCWSTQKIKNIYTLSTEDINQAVYRMHQLHFVDNLTQRLTYCYSINVTQYSLTKAAYTYWDNLRINSSEQGGLYNTQPLHVKGNLKSTTNSELDILGFFTASPSRTKRIFVRDVKDLDLYFLQCDWADIEKGDLNKNRTRYLIQVPELGLKLVEDQCVECDIFGGSSIKPDFWPY